MSNPKVDFFLIKPKSGKKLENLRRIVLDCELIEELKWVFLATRFRIVNIVLIHVFKEYCAILFIKGALLKDPNGILIQQTKNVHRTPDSVYQR